MMLNTFLRQAILIVLLCGFVSCDLLKTKSVSEDPPSPPIWPQQFTMSIYQQPGSSSQYATGKIWVNYPKNQMRIQRNSGQFDGYCQAVLPKTTSPCTQIFNFGYKYVIFPRENLCCQCCSINQPSCNFWKRDWMSNYTFVQATVVNYIEYFKWKQNISQDQQIVYTQTAQEPRIPRQLQMNKLGSRTYSLSFLGPLNTTDISDSMFTLPSYCKNKCPKSDFCQNNAQTIKEV